MLAVVDVRLLVKLKGWKGLSHRLRGQSLGRDIYATRRTRKVF